VDKAADAFTRQKRKEKVEQIRNGDLNEYWLQFYIKKCYKKLGFSEISGPYDRGYDFRGVKNGKEVVIEAERKPYWFLNHGHKKDEVDFLIVETDDETLRELLPKNIIIVDPVDLEEKTRDARRHYAENIAPIIQARREAEQRSYKDPGLFMLGQIAHSLRSLYANVFEEDIYEDTLEDHSMNEAASAVAIMYIWHYDLGKSKGKEEGTVIPKIVGIDNRILKHGADTLSEADWEHLTMWLSLLRDEYTKKF
jgi:hypothetical protein